MYYQYSSPYSLRMSRSRRNHWTCSYQAMFVWDILQRRAISKSTKHSPIKSLWCGHHIESTFLRIRHAPTSTYIPSCWFVASLSIHGIEHVSVTTYPNDRKWDAHGLIASVTNCPGSSIWKAIILLSPLTDVNALYHVTYLLELPLPLMTDLLI